MTLEEWASLTSSAANNFRRHLYRGRRNMSRRLCFTEERPVHSLLTVVASQHKTMDTRCTEEATLRMVTAYPSSTQLLARVLCRRFTLLLRR